MEQRKLNDEEIEQIAKEVATQIKQDLYVNVGSGILALVWKGILLIVIALAAYGLNSKMLHWFN